MTRRIEQSPQPAVAPYPARERRTYDRRAGARSVAAASANEGAVVRLSAAAKGLLAVQEEGLQGTASRDNDARAFAQESLAPVAIDVDFEPVSLKPDEIRGARIVSAEALRSEQVDPVVWLTLGGLPAACVEDGTEVVTPVDDSWPGLHLVAEQSDDVDTVMVSLETARRTSFGGFDHPHSPNGCGFCRRAAAAYR